MNTKKLTLTIAALLMLGTGASAQGLLGKLKDKAVKAAKQKVEKKVEQKVEQAVDGALDGNSQQVEEAAEPAQPQEAQSPAQTSTTTQTGNLGLPKNTDGPQPAENARPDESYIAVIRYPSHSEELYFDAKTRRQYRVRREDPTKRSLTINDSLVTYSIDDKRKTISVMSFAGAEGVGSQKKKINYKKEVVEYRDRWCIRESYTTNEQGVNGRLKTDFVLWRDIETGISLREDQNGGPMNEVVHVTLGNYPEKAFSMPTGYETARTIDIGKLMKAEADAENSDNPEEAKKELLKNLDQYYTRKKK